MEKQRKKASDNIFLDLGFGADEAAALQIRANLMTFACISKRNA